MSYTVPIYGARLKVQPKDLDLYSAIVDHIFPHHPGTISVKGPRIARITDRSKGEIENTRYAFFRIAFPVSKKLRTIVNEKLITAGYAESFLGSPVVVFPDYKYLLFVKHYYDADKVLGYILDVLNPTLWTPGKFIITAKLDHDTNLFEKRIESFKSYSRLRITVKTVENPDILEIRNSLDNLKDILDADQYSLEYYMNEKNRRRQKSLNLTGEAAKETIEKLAKSGQVDIDVTGKPDGGRSKTTSTSDVIRSEEAAIDEVEDTRKYLIRCFRLFQTWNRSRLNHE